MKAKAHMSPRIPGGISSPGNEGKGATISPPKMSSLSDNFHCPKVYNWSANYLLSCIYLNNEPYDVWLSC